MNNNQTNEKVKKYKLAVIIGESCRNTTENMDNIECFLDLFDVEYDIYACVDKPEELSAYKNIVSNVSFESVSDTPVVSKMEQTCGKYMHGASWQFIKCNVAVQSIIESTHYTHMMKLRTDCVFRFPEMFSRMFPHSTNIDASHVNEMKNMFKQFLNVVYNNKSISIMGDKIALGEYNATKNWFENFIDPECLQKMYAKPPNGPDHTAANKAWRYNKVPTALQSPFQYGSLMWVPLQWYHLTWLTNADNTVKSKSERKGLSVGLRGSAAKVTRPINDWQHIMNVTKTVKKFI